jgi:hypothetical protein
VDTINCVLGVYEYALHAMISTKETTSTNRLRVSTTLSTNGIDTIVRIGAIVLIATAIETS